MKAKASRRIYMNEDNHHFYGCHPPEDMSVEGIYRLVDVYAEGTQVGGIFFCVNVQRALFPSKVWETFWEDYDPALGEEQPALLREHGIRNHLLLRERGLDQFALWLERCRHHGIEGWLSMRMNDCHGLEEHARRYPGAHRGIMEWPTQLWRAHPEWRRAPWRWERSWEGAYDFAQPAVREHHLALIREVFERYDPFGLELDWMRWGLMFAPGKEQEGRAILVEFLRKVREFADGCARRVGHPVLLAHRVPAEPDTCLQLGYDLPAWVDEGLADRITLSAFLGCANFNYPMEIWRRMLGDEVKILAHAESRASSHPDIPEIKDHAFLYGAAASALHRGADGIYLFNECYRESDAPELLRYMLTHTGDEETLAKVDRRHAITYPQVRAAGEPLRTVLPIPLRVPTMGRDFGRMEENVTLRIFIGSRPKTGRAVLRLVFSKETPPDSLQNLEIRLNGIPVCSCEQPESAEGIFATFELPLDVLQDDVNVVEWIPPQVPGSIEWAEIALFGIQR